MAAVRILSVEDVQPIKEFVQKVLELHGYIVESCDSGDDAVKLLALGRRFDGVVCNLRMPHFTGNLDEHTLEFLHGSGVTCLEVPYKPSDLVNIVQAVIGKPS